MDQIARRLLDTGAKPPSRKPVPNGNGEVTMALVDADGGTDVLAVKTDCHAACQSPTTKPAGARHSRNSRRSSRRVTTCAVCPFLRLLMAASMRAFVKPP